MNVISRLIEQIMWVWTDKLGQGVWYGIAMTTVATFKTLAQKVKEIRKREEKEMKKRTDP